MSGKKHEKGQRSAVDVPDGGYGWMVVLASHLVHLIVLGTERSSGVLYLILQDRFHQTATATAWVTTIPSAMRLMLGPVSSYFCNRYSGRTVVMFGGVILSTAVFVSGYSTNLPIMYFVFGFVGGIGRSFVFVPAVTMVGLYFCQKRGRALGLSTLGAGVGGFVLPLLLEIVFEYYGFQGGFYILAGISLNICVCGMLFRPVSQRGNPTERAQQIKEEKTLAYENIGYENGDIEKRSFTTYGSENIHRNGNDGVICIKISKKDTSKTERKQNYKCTLESEINTHHNLQNSSASEPKHAKNEEAPTNSYCQNPSEMPAKTKKTPYFECNLLKDYCFTCFCLCFFLYSLAFQSAFVFLPAFGKQLGNNDLEATYLVAITCGCDGISRVLSGILFDFKSVRKFRRVFVNISIFLIGIISFVIPLTRTYKHLCVVCGIYGFLLGPVLSQRSLCLIDILGVEKLVSSFGIFIWFQGVGFLIGPPISGYLKDINGKYDFAFYFGGCCIILGALIFGISSVIHSAIK